MERDCEWLKVLMATGMGILQTGTKQLQQPILQYSLAKASTLEVFAVLVVLFHQNQELVIQKQWDLRLLEEDLVLSTIPTMAVLKLLPLTFLHVQIHKAP